MAQMRLDRLLSNFSPLSRTEAREALRRGRVQVDGVPEQDGARKLDPAAVTVTLDGVPLRTADKIYLMMNKPAGFVTSTEEKGQRTVLELLGPEYAHCELFPAGRLDKDTEGFLLLTNDGDFCHRVISPRSETVKCYYLRADRPLEESDVRAIAEGVVLRDGTRCRPARLEPFGDGREARIWLTEGKYHEVRRLIASRSNAVTYLKRLSIGGVELDSALAPGAYRELTEAEKTAILGLKSDESVNSSN